MNLEPFIFLHFNECNDKYDIMFLKGNDKSCLFIVYYACARIMTCKRYIKRIYLVHFPTQNVDHLLTTMLIM